MANSADTAVRKYGKQKHTSKKERQDRSQAAREASLQSKVLNSSTALELPESDKNPKFSGRNDKENSDPIPNSIPGPSTPLQKAQSCASRLTKDVDKFRKKFTYWKGQAVDSRESLRDMRENEKEERKKGEQRAEDSEKQKIIEDMENELEREKKQRKLDADEHKTCHAHLNIQLHEYHHQIHTLKARVNRIPARLSTAMKRVVHTYNNEAEEQQAFYFKSANRTIPNEAHDILLDLVAIDEVPANKVTHVFKHIAEAFGISIHGNVDRRSIGRIVKEGGNAAKLQFGQAVIDAKGVTISSDGTTHKNETYETKHSTVILANRRL
ncbi:hypothetical protein F5050DRAFT_1716178 [Lentinula boryana]|uniref:Uncharacterized protein n=1 Tax=Lentinula boryana TaxID=40481 RepID=A0ABQ8PY22_9AGAR|nr:hypothetical protein F5050DRAFT_1716178 [Lentinula boryana]